MASYVKDEFGVRNCAICLEDMISRNPRALTCLHSFCTECLQQLVTPANAIECPVCRKASQLDVSGILCLPENFYLKDNNMFSMSKNCDECFSQGQVSAAVNTCDDCDIILCKMCSIEHLKVAVFANHCAKPIKPKRFDCRYHNKMCSVFCRNCTQALCALCVRTHKEHQESICDLETGIKEQLVNIKQKLPIELKENNKVKNLALLIIANIEQTKNEVRSHTDKLKNDLEILSDKLINDLDVNYTQPCQKLLAQTDQWGTLLKSGISLTKEAEKNPIGEMVQKLEDMSKLLDSPPEFQILKSMPVFKPKEISLDIGTIIQGMAVDKSAAAPEMASSLSPKQGIMASNLTTSNGLGEQAFNIFIRNNSYSSQTITLTVKATDSIMAIKNKLQDRIGIHRSRIKFRFANKLLNDDHTLKYFGISR